MLGLGALEYALLAPAACIVAILLLADGAPAALALTLPWAIAVPIGFVAALWAVDRREALRRGSGGWREQLAQGLDSIHVLKRSSSSASISLGPIGTAHLLVRRHLLPLGVPAGVHAGTPASRSCSSATRPATR